MTKTGINVNFALRKKKKIIIFNITEQKQLLASVLFIDIYFDQLRRSVLSPGLIMSTVCHIMWYEFWV